MKIFRSEMDEMKWWVTLGGLSMIAAFWVQLPAAIFVVLVILRTILLYWRKTP
jgi:hypothetical protein